MKPELDKLAVEGWVSALPDGDLTLYNYTPATVYERHWTPETLAARGLILDPHGRIVANPFPKFFNLNEAEHTRLEALPTETPEMADKLDGTLVIVFWDSRISRFRAVTRGSWHNRFTEYAHDWLDRQPQQDWDRRYTYLFELIAPWNRIVVAYPADELVLIGVRETESGEDLSYSQLADWVHRLGVRAVGWKAQPLAEVDLADATKQNEEGFVCRYSTGLRVKLKYEQYKVLHKIVTGLSVKGIWEHLSAGQELDLGGVPDEFHAWYREQRGIIVARKAKLQEEVEAAWKQTGTLPTRKDYALTWATLDRTLKASLFCRLDGKPYDDLLWKAIKPKGNVVYRVEEL